MEPTTDDAKGRVRLAGAFDLYREAIREAQVAEMLHGRSAFSRQGPLSAWVVIWLMIFQRLHPKGSLSVGVRELLTGPVQAQVSWPEGKKHPCRAARKKPKGLSANTSAYSQARSKLPLDVGEKVSDQIFASLWAQPKPKTLPGLDRPLFLLDGTSLLLAHTPELGKAFPPAQNQHGRSHWPVMRVVVAHDVASGLATRPRWGPMYGAQATSEQALAKILIRQLPKGCGYLADRNFGIFAMAYQAQQENRPCLVRLTKARAGKLNGGVPPCAKTDKRIHWTPTRDDLRNNPEIPADAWVEGRLLAFKLRNGRTREKLYIFTTFDLPAEQISAMYDSRWNIETDLRSLKREVRIHMLEAKSPAMVEKELVLSVAAYNLTRAAMNAAGRALNLDPRQFSFSQAQDTINAYLPVFASARSEAERQQIVEEMLRVFAQSKLPRRRKRRSYPRAVWPRPCSFPKRKVNKKCKKGKAAGNRNVTKKGVA